MPVIHSDIERLYEVCSNFSKPSLLQSCDCCHEEDAKQVLLNTPLRELSNQQLWDFSFSVFTTIGCVDDFLYFLPRILHLAFIEPYDAIDLGLLGHKLYQSNYWDHSEILHLSLIHI